MTEPATKEPEGAELDDRPPVLGSWRNIYVVVLGILVVVIALFTVITGVYA